MKKNKDGKKKDEEVLKTEVKEKYVIPDDEVKTVNRTPFATPHLNVNDSTFMEDTTVRKILGE